MTTVAMRFAAFVFDADRRRLSREDRTIRLTPKACDLLALLVAEAPRVVSKAELHQRLWPGTFVSDAALASLVKEIRRALHDHDRSAPILRTAHGVGYAMNVSVERRPAHRPAVATWLVVGERRVALTEGENLVGRDPSAEVFLDVKGVSRRHARIVVSDDGAFLEDLGSKNGTIVRDRAVTHRITLRDGDPIEFGPVVVVYRLSAAPASTTTVARRARP